MTTSKQKVAEQTRIHYQTLFETSIEELRFEKMSVAHLVSVLEEIKEVDDKLAGLIAENGINRHEIDKVIHAKELLHDKTN